MLARRAPPTGVMLLAAVTVFWGISWPAMKIVLNEMPVLPFRAICCVAGGLGGLLLARLMGDPIRLPRREIPSMAAMALLNVTGWQIFMAYGLRALPAGHASIIAYTMPAFALLLSRIFLGERLTTPRLWGLALSMAGLAVLVAPDIRNMRAAPMGTLFMVMASASWAGGTVGMKCFRWSLSVMQTTGWQFVLGGIPIVLAAIVERSAPGLGALSSIAWICLIYVLMFPVLFCQWAWLKAVGTLPVSVSAMGTLAIPVVGAVSGALLLDEQVTLAELVALGLVVAGLAVVAIRSPAAAEA